MSCLEETHDRFKHHTDRFKHHAEDELIEINNKICDIKDVLSKKPNEDDLQLITSKMDLLFIIVKKQMEIKDAGKNLLYFLYIFGSMGPSVFSSLYIKLSIFSHSNIVQLYIYGL